MPSRFRATADDLPRPMFVRPMRFYRNWSLGWRPPLWGGQPLRAGGQAPVSRAAHAGKIVLGTDGALVVLARLDPDATSAAGAADLRYLTFDRSGRGGPCLLSRGGSVGRSTWAHESLTRENMSSWARARAPTPKHSYSSEQIKQAHVPTSCGTPAGEG